ncbi:MAG: AEC family transporter, partial [Candidatus Omnitrophica bacterium]|nr:AEC family transporter [Candidatus Omnitrophota bacterium]
FIFKKKGDKFQFKSLMTPPVVSTVVSLLLIYTGISKFVPLMLIEPVRMVGDVSFVFSMIVLGCWLSKVKFEGVSKSLRFVAQASIVKLIILPTLFLIGLLYFKEVSLLGVFIILQAAMPSAASLPIVVNFREANSGFVSQGVFVTHLFSIVTIPIWLGIYLKLSNFSF